MLEQESHTACFTSFGYISSAEKKWRFWVSVTGRGNFCFRIADCWSCYEDLPSPMIAGTFVADVKSDGKLKVTC